MIKPIIFRKHSKSLATNSDIQAFEVEFGIKLPPTFVEFCAKYNGGFPMRENRFYPVPEIFREFHNEYNEKPAGVITDCLFGLTKEIDACNIRDEFHSLREMASIQGLFPISADLFGNSAVLQVDDLNGKVYWRDHELWEAPEHPYLMPIAENLEIFYNSLTRDPCADE